eukprot:344009-Prymnesium_polylepis.1
MNHKAVHGTCNEGTRLVKKRMLVSVLGKHRGSATNNGSITCRIWQCSPTRSCYGMPECTAYPPAFSGRLVVLLVSCALALPAVVKP